MPIVKVHISTQIKADTCSAVITELRDAIVEIIGVSYDHAHVIIHSATQVSEQLNDQTNNHYVFIEIYMFSGRTDNTKELLFNRLAETIKNHLDIERKDVFFNILDSDKNDWAGKDGVPFSKLIPD